MTQQPLSDVDSALLKLAPLQLENHRETRYDGSGFSLTLDRFAPEDAQLIGQIYQTVKQIYDLWFYSRDRPDHALLEASIKSLISDESFLKATQSLGRATYALHSRQPEVRKVVHDLRGGAISALVGYVSMLQAEMIEHLPVPRLVYLARDHAKMMRNAVIDLDVHTRAIDEASSVHFVEDMQAKWPGMEFNQEGRQVRIDFQCHYEGSISNCCLETSATDRIIYNLLNNAARFAADDQVRFSVFPVDRSVVRLVVDNAVDAAQAAWLEAHTADDLGRLFRGGLTRGGQGLGLSNCADFITKAFGLESVDLALEAGYIGAVHRDKRFYVWFHWPQYRPADGEATCDCAR